MTRRCFMRNSAFSHPRPYKKAQKLVQTCELLNYMSFGVFCGILGWEKCGCRHLDCQYIMIKRCFMAKRAFSYPNIERWPPRVVRPNFFSGNIKNINVERSHENVVPLLKDLGEGWGALGPTFVCRLLAKSK